ncbi:ABC transporter ATP-binding protein [Pseudochelatococcus lubricantis]|uniref:ABC transporter ATP-binding protein n=1 Tax=Pseudochelatococcus lubricantis TaxID=1538102 RepID=UPI0035E86748
MADLVIENFSRSYASFKAVDDMSLTVKGGEFLTFLGPSGCGKSTTLFSIAGLDTPTAGSIRIGDRYFYDSSRSISVPAEKRNLGLVFQSYALWPHMTARQNLAFPLKLRKISGRAQQAAIEEALTLVEMLEFADRYPFELSGGQQQRVALARALVYRPEVLLLDEPLSNLDAKLRERARVWLRELQQRLGVTTIYVTHDQFEALAISDRIVVMNRGKILQIGTPQELYERPATPFVADFLGSANFFDGRVIANDDGIATIQLANDAQMRVPSSVGPGRAVKMAVRPERIELVDGPQQNTLEVDIGPPVYLGSVYQYEATLSSVAFRIQSPRQIAAKRVFAHIPSEAAILFPS